MNEPRRIGELTSDPPEPLPPREARIRFFERADLPSVWDQHNSGPDVLTAERIEQATDEERRELEARLGLAAKKAWDSIGRDIGKRYVSCRFDNYETTTDDQAKAVDQCRTYVADGLRNFETGRSLCLIGPKGTGKDHLLVATLFALLRLSVQLNSTPPTLAYRDGLGLFNRFRSTFDPGSSVDETDLVRELAKPHFLALSDPVPPVGTCSEYEKRVLLQVIDRRYRDLRPILATMNVRSRSEAEERFGSQASDRLFDSTEVVFCNWESYRGRKP